MKAYCFYSLLALCIPHPLYSCEKDNAEACQESPRLTHVIYVENDRMFKKPVTPMLWVKRPLFYQRSAQSLSPAEAKKFYGFKEGVMIPTLKTVTTIKFYGCQYADGSILIFPYPDDYTERCYYLILPRFKSEGLQYSERDLH